MTKYTTYDGGIWVIKSLTEKNDETGESLYWSNSWGWVDGDSGLVTFFDLPTETEMVGENIWEDWT